MTVESVKLMAWVYGSIASLIILIPTMVVLIKRYKRKPRVRQTILPKDNEGNMRILTQVMKEERPLFEIEDTLSYDAPEFDEMPKIHMKEAKLFISRIKE